METAKSDFVTKESCGDSDHEVAAELMGALPAPRGSGKLGRVSPFALYSSFLFCVHKAKGETGAEAKHPDPGLLGKEQVGKPG